MNKKNWLSSPHRNKYYFLFSFLFCSLAALSQTVTGNVTDADQKPISKVTVQVKGSSRETITDDAGLFRIQASGTDVLVFTYVGYASREVPLNGQNNIHVVLAVDSRNLESVVVTALGIRRESKKLGYSAETVKVNEIQQNRTTNLSSALEGKVAGLDISPPSAGAGSSNKIRLRGQSAFAGGTNSPLIVINGLPMDQGAQGANGSVNTRDNGDNLLLINPDDIESMTVLKGATAAALYGSRAGNGAIIITTKNGNKNTGIGVEYTSNFAADQALDYTDFQYVYGQGVNGTRPKTQGDAISSGQFGWGEKYDAVPTIQFDGVQRPYEPHHHRINDFFRTGTSFTNTLALSGGTAKGSFRASYSNQDAKGIEPWNDYHRKIFNVGINHNLSDKLSVQINLNYTNQKNDNPPQVGVQGQGSMNFIVRTSPTVPLEVYKEKAVSAQGTEAQTTGFAQTIINPYWLGPREFYINRNDRLLGTATLRYDFFKWLFLQGRVNMDYNSGSLEQNNPGGTGSPPNGAYYDNTKTTFGGTYDVNQGSGRDMNYDFLAGGNHKFGNFSLDLSFGGNIRTSEFRNLSAHSEGFIIRDLYTLGNGTVFNQGYGYSKTQTNSLYGIAEFGYSNFLYLNVTGRNDWFSILNPKNDNYFYPSVSGSFIFTELLRNKLSWLNYGKLRASWADVGSANGVPVYYGNLTYGFNQQQYLGYTIANINNADAPNPSLKPFSVTEKELGLEFRMFDSRLHLDVAAYDKRTTDQILTSQISQASGYNSTLINTGSLQNRGIEFLIDGTIIRKRNFSWSSSFNTSYMTSKVLSLAPGVNRFVVVDWYNGGASNEFMGKLVYEVGKPLNQISAKTYKRDSSGQVLLNSNGRLIASDQEVDFGSSLPKFIGGWSNTFRYKQLSLFVQMDYKAGGYMLSGSALNNLRQGHSKASLVGRNPGENGVVFNGVYASGPNAGKPNTTAVFGQQFYADYRTLQIADPFIYKSDFIKLRNITLSYDLSRWISSKTAFVKGIIVSASCRNVAILKKYVPDIDPEAVASSGDFRAGYEAVSLPTTRTYGFNVNVKF